MLIGLKSHISYMMHFLVCVGAAGLGIFSTFILPNTLEDFLGLGIGGVVGYAALLNLPLRRNDAKEKLQNVAGKFAEVFFYLAP